MTRFNRYTKSVFLSHTLLIYSKLHQSQSFIVHPVIQTVKGVGSSSLFSIKKEMPRGVKKENLPTKICVTCKRPFTWRKKWEDVWEEVTTCSKSCNRQRRQQKQEQNKEFRMNIINENSRKETNNELDNIKPLHSNHVENQDMSLSIDELNQKIEDELSLHNNKTNASEDTQHNDDIMNSEEKAKAERKAEKKRKKEERRAQRQGQGDPSAGQKQCDMCTKQVDLLIRCTYDETLDWKMVCGKCWKNASGGIVDGDALHPYYRYGGLWKNRRRK
jgi:hypothetical protein